MVLAIVATAITRLPISDSPARLWLRSLHSLSVAAAAAIIVTISEVPVGVSGQWTIAAVLMGLAVYGTVNAWATPPMWKIRTFAVAGYVASAAYAMAAATTGDGHILATALVIAGLSLLVAVVAGIIADTVSPWRQELTWLAGGLGVVAIGGILATYQLTETEPAIVLIVLGAALAGYGTLARTLVAVEGALVVWLLAFVVLVNEQIAMGLHMVVIVASITLLGVVELERMRRDIDELAVPEWLDHLEWALMLAPLGLATVDMFDSLWFGFVLLAEGFVLTTWGALTEVRRRAMLGVGAMVLAIVLSIALPALHGLMEGLTGGTWLAAGAIAATVFIIAGSAIERQRHAIGRQLAHIGDILEHWK